MKTLKKLTAVLTALSLITSAAVPLTVSYAAPVALTAAENTGSAYPAPMTTDRSSDAYKTFISAKPIIRQNSQDSWWSYTCIEWTPVKNALLYYVYQKKGNGYTLVYKTLDSRCWTDEDGSYYVRPVTYDYNDRRIFGKASDKIEIKTEPYYFDDYEYEDGGNYADDDGYYESGAYEEVEPIDDGYYDVADSISGADGLSYSAGMPDTLDNEEYSHYTVDGFKKASDTPLSTFSADVDTASYTNVRRLLNDGYTIDPDAVRIEEFLNYFDYNYRQPTKGNFNINYEYTDCPWNKNAKLLMLGVKAKDVKQEPASNLVFLIDVSGSMYSQDKLPLVVDSLKKLSAETTKNDKISIVTYSGEERVVISGATGNMKNCISELTGCLEANGVTNGESGINMAYDIAAKNYIKGGSNRVILATDGDLNVGITDKDELSEFIAQKRDTGIYLTVLGFGTGNLKDNKMEALAKDGNGNYHYIDCAQEATKVLVDERRKTLITVADDVKLQVEFNPVLVDSYRLIGYDGRRLNNEDFTDDRKDAADMGAGQSITVMYEIIPAKNASSSLEYQTLTGNRTNICTLKLRYKKAGSGKSVQSKVVIKADKYLKYSETGIRFKFASCVLEAAMALKNESSYGNVSLRRAINRFKRLDANELSAIGYSDDFALMLDNLADRYLVG